MYKCLVIVLLFVVLVNAVGPKGAPHLVDGAPPGFADALKGKYKGVLAKIKTALKGNPKPEDAKKKVEQILTEGKVDAATRKKLKQKN